MNAGTCIHYSGLLCGKQFEQCRAGVHYRKTFGSEPGIFYRLPCVTPTDRKGIAMIPCTLRQLPTAEQIAEADREMEVATKKHIAAIKIAGQWRVKPKPEQDRHEAVECPVCKGRLHLSQSAYNGHVHGACETQDCVRWME